MYKRWVLIKLIFTLLLTSSSVFAKSATEILEWECNNQNNALACYKLSEVYFGRKKPDKAIEYLSRTCEINYAKYCQIRFIENIKKKKNNNEYTGFINKLVRCDNINWTKDNLVKIASYYSTKKNKNGNCIYQKTIPNRIQTYCEFSSKNING